MRLPAAGSRLEAGKGRIARLGLPSSPARRPALLAARRAARGLTLIEVLIVMGIVALIMGAVVIGSGQAAGARKRHSSTMIAGAIRIAFSRASATSKSVRLVMDFTENAIWLEEGDQPMLVQSKDVTGTGGAAAATGAEKEAIEEGGRIVKGPTAPRASFKEIDAMGVAASAPGKAHKPLDDGIKFREVQTGHDDVPRKEGRAYLYFWPGGQTERASIQLRSGGADDEQSALTLLVAPLTGKVTVKDGAVAVAQPSTDQESSEREDPGAF